MLCAQHHKHLAAVSTVIVALARSIAALVVKADAMAKLQFGKLIFFNFNSSLFNNTSNYLRLYK
jgi:hypothetical protein